MRELEERPYKKLSRKDLQKFIDDLQWHISKLDTTDINYQIFTRWLLEAKEEQYTRLINKQNYLNKKNIQ